MDWFVGYGADDEQRIAIAALTVNKEYWTIKSAELAKMLFHRSFETAQAEPEIKKAPAKRKRTASGRSRDD